MSGRLVSNDSIPGIRESANGRRKFVNLQTVAEIRESANGDS